MKIKNINGTIEITLEDSDKVILKTSKSDDKAVKISATGDGLDICGNDQIINKISGEGMLEKVYLPPILSKEEIIAKCDEWLDMFKKIYDIFSNQVLTPEYKNNNISLKLSFGTYFSDDDEGRTIDLDLYNFGNYVKYGATLSIKDKDMDIYRYIVARVLEYYLSQNLSGKKIDYVMNWNGQLYSNKDSSNGIVSILANLCSLTEEASLNRLVYSILANHNISVPLDQIIANLMANIKNRPMPIKLEDSINFTKRQYDMVTKKEDSPLTLTREKKA